MDLVHAKASGWLLIFTMLYMGCLFSLISHRLFAVPGQIRPVLVIASFFIAIFIMLIDSYCVVGSQWFLEGIEQIHRMGGLDISGGRGAKLKARIFLALRIMFSICLAQLTAICMSLILFGDDINERIQNAYATANAALINDATRLVDGEIERTTAAVTAQSARVEALSSQTSTLRQHEIDPSSADPQVQAVQKEVDQLLAQKTKADDDLREAEKFASNELGGIRGAAENSGHAGEGPRYRAARERVANARTHVREIAEALAAARNRLDALHKLTTSKIDATKRETQNRLPTFEASLSAESDKLANLKEQLSKLVNGRNDAIRNAIDSAPNHVDFDRGFLAQIRVLDEIAHADLKFAGVIMLIDVTSFGFELAAVLAKITTFSPTTYAALIARDSFLRSVRIADEIVRELDLCAKKVENEAELLRRNTPADPDAEPGEEDHDEPPESPPQPPKRGRGRPRKNPPQDP
jgi:archaellum component FlaC